jgi:glycosyltransferase involved in cell wall biosynthesis/predicted SAM-dependent methyltransferase
MLSLSIIIPSKNEEGNIKKLIQGIWDALVPYKPELKYEVVVVDDSSDNTAMIAQSMVIKGRGLGLAQAVLDGVDTTSSDCFIVMDADLQHPPNLLPDMVKQLQRHDLVIATKHAKGTNADMSWWRKLQSNLAVWLTHVVIPAPVSDPMTGFFGIRRKCLDGIPRGEYIKLDYEKINKDAEQLKESKPEDWDTMSDDEISKWYLQHGYGVELIGLEAIGFKIGLELFAKAKWVSHGEVPMSFAKREAGMSKGTMHSLQKHLWRLFKNSLSYEIELPKGGEEYHHFYEGNDWHRKWKQDIAYLLMDISNELKPEKVLDIGCGSSPNINFFSGKRVGIDIRQDALDWIKDYSSAEFKYGSVLDIPFPKDSFDIVSCIEVLEHLDEQEVRKALGEITRVLKPNGHAILATPNYASIRWNIIENVQHILQPGAWTKDHKTKLKHQSLNSLCQEFGLEEIRYDGVQHNMDMLITYQKMGA